MKEECELPDPACDPRRRARVVRERVDRDRAARQVEPARLARRLRSVEAAGRKDDELRPALEGLRPARPERGLSRLPEHVLAAGDCDHLGHPVTGGVRGLEPLGDEDAPPGGAGDEARHLLDRLSQLADHGLAAPGHAEPGGERRHALRDPVYRPRVERDHLRAERRDASKLAARDRADLAEVLRDDHVRRERPDQLLVDRVERAALGDGRPHRLVDLEARERARVDPRRRHDRQIEHGVGPVAFLRAPDEAAGEPEVGDDLGRAREKGADLQVTTCVPGSSDTRGPSLARDPAVGKPSPSGR